MNTSAFFRAITIVLDDDDESCRTGFGHREESDLCHGAIENRQVEIIGVFGSFFLLRSCFD